MKTKKVKASAPLVERATPNTPPTAFRIWAAGDVDFDGGHAVFSERSAEALAKEQADRGRPLCFDFNHMSLSPDARPESTRAAGWFEVEIRKDDQGRSECWATNIEWCEDVAAGMSKEVPEYRFYSPAFTIDTETEEIVSLTNVAITGNPRTHRLTQLCSFGEADATGPNKSLVPPKGSGATMSLSPEQALAALADPNTTPEDRQAALEVLAALLASMSAPKEEVATSEPDPTEDKKASVALAVTVLALRKEMDALKTAQLLASAPALPLDIRAWAEKQSPATVKSFLASATSFRAPVAQRNESPSIGPVPTGTDPSIQAEVDRHFNLSHSAGPIGLGAPVNGQRVLTSALQAKGGK